MRLIVVGAGGATRDLLRGLDDIWDVTVVDPDEDLLALASNVREIDTVRGDGSSRVVLRQAQLDEADALVAATNNDDVNLEACRLAREASVVRIMAAAANPERLPEYREDRVPAFSADRLIARSVELSLEPSRITSAAFADGKAEAVEFHITLDAPVVGKTLAQIASKRWLVASVLRAGRLIVPHGRTTLEVGDVVTTVGAAADYGVMVRAFTSGGARFPIEFGKQVAVALDSLRSVDGPVGEAAHLVRNSSADSLLLVHRDPAKLRDPARAELVESLLEAAADRASGVTLRTLPITGSPDRRLSKVVDEASVGVVVMSAPTGSELRRRLRVPQLLAGVRSMRVPVLFSRGQAPYDKVVLHLTDTPAGRAAAGAAVDIAAYANVALTGVAAVPALPTPGVAREAALRALARLREESAAAGIQVTRRMRRGAPARLLEDEATSGLVVMPALRGIPTILQPGVVGHVLRRSPASLLLLPASI